MDTERDASDFDVVQASSCSCKDNLLEAVVRGIPEDADYIRLIETCYPKFDFKHALWDFRNSSVSGLSHELFDLIGDATAPFAEKRGEGAKTAILVKSESDLLLFRAFAERLKNVLTCETRAFLSEEEARDWLAA